MSQALDCKGGECASMKTLSGQSDTYTWRVTVQQSVYDLMR